MKRIALLFIILLPLYVFGQSTGRLPYKTVRQSYHGDTTKTTLGTNNVEHSTNLDGYSYDKQLIVRDTSLIELIQEHGGGGGGAANTDSTIKTDKEAYAGASFGSVKAYRGSGGSTVAIRAVSTGESVADVNAVAFDNGTSQVVLTATNIFIDPDAGLIVSILAPPSSATDTGIRGEIRVTEDYIYVCTLTNTWKRVAIATW